MVQSFDTTTNLPPRFVCLMAPCERWVTRLRASVGCRRPAPLLDCHGVFAFCVWLRSGASCCTTVSAMQLLQWARFAAWCAYSTALRFIVVYPKLPVIPSHERVRTAAVTFSITRFVSLRQHAVGERQSKKARGGRGEEEWKERTKEVIEEVLCVSHLMRYKVGCLAPREYDGGLGEQVPYECRTQIGDMLCGHAKTRWVVKSVNWRFGALSMLSLIKKYRRGRPISFLSPSRVGATGHDD